MVTTRADINVGVRLRTPLLTLATAGILVLASRIFAEGDIRGSAIAFVVVCGAVLLVLPVWWDLLICTVFVAISPGLKYLAAYNTVVHLGAFFMMGILLMRWLVSMAIRRDSGGLDKLPLATLIAAFVGLSFVMLFTPMTTPLVGVGGIATYILPIMFYPLAFAEIRTRARMRVFLMLTIGLALVGAILTLVFGVLGPERVAAFGPGFAQVALEGGSFYTVASQAGVSWKPMQVVGDVIDYMLAVIIIVAMLTHVGNARRRVILSAFAALTLLVLIASLVVGGVRLAMAGTVIGVLIVVLAGRRRAILPTLLSLALLIPALNIVASFTQGGVLARAATLLNPGDALTSSGRVDLLSNIPNLIVNSPLGLGMGRSGPGAQAVISAVGAGLGALGYDNMLLSIMAEMGDLGGILLSAIALLFIVRSWQVYTRLVDPELKSIALGCTAVSVAVTATWISGPVLMIGQIALFYWALAGVCFALPYVEQAQA